MQLELQAYTSCVDHLDTPTAQTSAVDFGRIVDGGEAERAEYG
jgi:hypothetical protein